MGTLAGGLALAAAVFVFRTAPDRRVAWRFGGMLLLETIMVCTSGTGPLNWVARTGVPVFWMRVHIANDGLLIASYLPALAVTLRSSRLLSPFRSDAIALTMVGIGLLNAVMVFVYPGAYLDPDLRLFTPNDLRDHAGSAWTIILGLLVISYGFGLIAILAARTSAVGVLARRQATILALAFGTRDLSWGVLYSIALYASVFGFPDELIGAPRLMGVTISASLVIYILLTAYGVASSNLFNIDLKVKWTLERGTIAAIFIAVFFMVSEGASAFLSDQLGSFVGILATGALVFALAPLQRAVEKLSNTAMPSVQDTPEYRSYRKLQIYGEALSEAMRDGSITPIERVVLNRLRAQLELDDAEAAALEQEFGDAGGTS